MDVHRVQETHVFLHEAFDNTEAVMQFSMVNLSGEVLNICLGVDYPAAVTSSDLASGLG